MSGYSHSSATRSVAVILARPFKAGIVMNILKHRISDAWAIPTLKHSSLRDGEFVGAAVPGLERPG